MLILFYLRDYIFMISCFRLFLEVLNAFIIPEMQKIQDYTEKKICAVAMTRLLTQSEKILSDDYIAVW